MLMFFRFSTETQVTNGYMYAFINDFIMKNHDAQIWQTLTIVIMRLSNDATHERSVSSPLPWLTKMQQIGRDGTVSCFHKFLPYILMKRKLKEYTK